MQFSRRKLMSSIGASSAIGMGLPSGVAGESPPEVQTEELDREEARRIYFNSLSTDSVRSIREHLWNDGVTIDTSGIEGERISYSDDRTDHVVLQTRLVSNQNGVGHISIRFFEQVAAVTATIEDTVLKSNPAIQDNHPEDVVTAGEWYDYRTESNGAVSTQVTVGVDSCSTEDAGDLCLYLGALSGLTGAALVVVPEPTSSAVGLGTLGGVLSGSAGACAITEVVDEHAVDGCNFNSVDVCIDWNCSPKPISIDWCDPQINLKPNYTNC